MERGLSKVTQLVTNYPQGYLMWMGPITPLVIFCHPDCIRTLASASGIQAELVVVGAPTHLRASSPSLPSSHVAHTGPNPLPSSLAIFLFPSYIDHPNLTASFLLSQTFTPHPGGLGKRQDLKIQTEAEK